MTEKPPETTPEARPPEAATELPFQAEVQQVLQIVINSLYTQREIFLRELVSNACDALDRARFLDLTQKDIVPPDGELAIRLVVDKDSNSLTISDNGVGMTRDEAVKNLGTIARSGSSEFLRLHRDAARQKDQALKIIGQFGVGFYSAFMVASRVDVDTRSAQPGAEPVLWRSTGAGTFTVLAGTRATPGTTITLHLKEDATEFVEPHTIKDVIQKYSDFVHFPIFLGDEQLNRSRAIWSLPKAQVSDEQHTEFFRRLSGSAEQEPLLRVHYSVDAPLQFHALLYVPPKAPWDLYTRERRSGLRLYAKRVLISEHVEKLAPSYLRFLVGVVDSEDLSLNVSRELLQEDRTLQKLEQQVGKQVIKALRDLADNDKPRYELFWKEYGRVLKEGVANDPKNQPALVELCRWETMNTPAGAAPISLADYIAKMPPEQKDVYYVTGVGRRSVEKSPHLEVFRKRGFDVLFLTDPVDEWVVHAIPEWQGKPLVSVAGAELPLAPDAAGSEATPPAQVAAAIAACKLALGTRVAEVRTTQRLIESASCLVAADGGMSANLERMMKLLNREASESPRVLELNADHTIVKKLDQIAKENPASEQARLWAELLLDQALLADGSVPDPAALVGRIRELMASA